MKSLLAILVVLTRLPFGLVAAEPVGTAPVVPVERLARHFERFNARDEELYPQAVRNADATAWAEGNVPRFECPDAEFEATYYFRWWTFRKHLKSTPDGYIVTEFLPPVPWAGKHNSINCAAGHHLYEGRWLRDPRYLDDYSRFWFRGGGDPRRYSFWAADAIRARALVTGDDRVALDLLPDLVRNWEAWEREQRDPNGLYWQADGRDGMEVSISGARQAQGEGYRATINSYQYGDARAIAALARRAGQPELAAKFDARAEEIRRLVQTRLWDPDANFYKVIPRGQEQRTDVRELHGYTPWYFNLPDPAQSVAWRELLDPHGFKAPFGPTTAEQRHPRFAVVYAGHECQWNGPGWPYATAVTLTALANLLNRQTPEAISAADYFELLLTYSRSHRLKRDDGTVVPWIDENLNPFTGDWLARTRLKSWKDGHWDADKGGVERGKDYNHSTFCDLVITGLVGLRPREDDVVEVHPLLPTGRWDYFCLDAVSYHGRMLTILFDRDGTHYRRGTGLRVLADGVEIGAAPGLTRVEAVLPAKRAGAQRAEGKAANETGAGSGGWRKEPEPVLGGALGTCFDLAVLKDAGLYRLWFSWRPRKSLALVAGTDGRHWSGEPRIVLGPNPATDWEADINRPAVVKREDGYHLWYTAQTEKHSRIGYATSPDGVNWTRRSQRPVLVADAPWEKVAVMCPHVEWDAAAGVFRMWYSGGDQYEPDAIGYATSRDGLVWAKHPGNPVFRADSRHSWEAHKVTAGQIVREGGWHYLFYIGFRDEDHAQIGLARSRDGISGWERHPANPLIRPGENQWDHDACYKPYAIHEPGRWLLWYNGRRGNVEQIGLAIHSGDELGFD